MTNYEIDDYYKLLAARDASFSYALKNQLNHYPTKIDKTLEQGAQTDAPRRTQIYGQQRSQSFSGRGGGSVQFISDDPTDPTGPQEESKGPAQTEQSVQMIAPGTTSAQETQMIYKEAIGDKYKYESSRKNITLKGFTETLGIKHFGDQYVQGTTDSVIIDDRKLINQLADGDKTNTVHKGDDVIMLTQLETLYNSSTPAVDKNNLAKLIAHALLDPPVSRSSSKG